MFMLTLCNILHPDQYLMNIIIIIIIIVNGELLLNCKHHTISIWWKYVVIYHLLLSNYKQISGEIYTFSWMDGWKDWQMDGLTGGWTDTRTLPDTIVNPFGSGYKHENNYPICSIWCPLMSCGHWTNMTMLVWPESDSNINQ